MRASIARLLRHVAGKSQEISYPVYVRNISFISGEGNVKDYFSKYGEVIRVHLPLDMKQGVHQGYGFVHFKSKTSAIEATEDIRRPRLDNRLLFVKHQEEPRSAPKHHAKTQAK